MKLKNLLIALLLLIGVGSSFALDSGYYRLVSYNGKYLTENTSNHTMVCSDQMDNNYSQVWYLTVDGSNVSIKNTLTDRFIFSIDANGCFYTDPTSKYLTAGESDNVYTFCLNIDWVGLHCDNNNNVVYYTITETKSKWTLEAATVDPTTLAAQKAAISEATATDLLKVFTTTACTALKDGYAESDLAALPASVQSLAEKIKNNTWTTYSGWDKTERTFRIADYKAYSSHTRWTNILGLGWSFSRLTNPTGISVAAGDYIQVYVGEIPSGQSIQLEVAGDYQAAGTTYELKQGMNVLLMASSGNCFVQYEVDNTTDGQAPYTNINSYAPVTVHIEGGTVQGYFDLTDGDTNLDWAILQHYLLKGSTVDLKTDNLLFHMQTDLVKAACPEQMVELLGEWDKILNMEYSLMGLEAFDGYWNNMLSVTDMSGQDYMHASTYGTYYADYTLSSIMSYANMFSGGAIWGPAHENGHIFQKYINMIGQTEVSNNLFSNVAVYNNGHLTSRASNISTTFENMANNVFWNDRGIWERTHLYFQLYQFFHILGKKSDFYPALFKALRNDPMTHTAGIFTSAADDYLKFYKTCCSVSGYDLTEFFQAYGFFVIPSLTSYTLNSVTKDAYKVGDYGDYYLTVTQDEIDAAKQTVAAMNLPKANIIFIEDRITAPDATYEGATAGTKKTAFDANEFPIGQAGETGQYTTFSATCSVYKYNVMGSNVIMTGSGAVGFKVYDSTGTLRGIYNTYRFTLPEGIGTGYTIKAAAGNGTDATATFDATLETIVSDVTDVPSATAAVTVGSQITAESQLVSGKLYLIYYVGNDNNKSAYVKDTGSNYTGKEDFNATQNALYRFTNNGDGTWKIQNFATGNYWKTPTEDANKYMGVSAEASAGAWALNFQEGGNIAPSCNGHSLNRSGNNIHPWSTGTIVNNQFRIIEATPAFEEPEDFANKDIVVSSDAAATVQTGQWYVMFDRGANHGYLYENGENRLYNTATVPAGSATNNAKYLVRIVGWDNVYYLQTGLGHFFGAIEQSVNVPTTATASEQINLKKISSTDAHYYLSSAHSVVLDANDLSLGDATVVGWGTTAPTTIGGNNDWAFYPIEMIDASALKVSDVTVIQGNQTAGIGNNMQALLRMKVTPSRALTMTSLTATITGAEQLENVAVYVTSEDQLRAATASPLQLGTTAAAEGSVTIDLTTNNALAGNTTSYLWLTADVKSTATELAVIDASVSSLSYSDAYSTDDTVLDLSAIGNPDGQMCIYKQQEFLWTASQTSAQYYRIPTILNTADGGIIAFTDDRHNNSSDLGSHKIDVVMRKSMDGGLTWGDELLIAEGDGTSDAAYGYGDIAVVSTNSGKLIGLLAAGKKSYPSGMLHMGYIESSDYGATWTAPTDIYSSINKNGLDLTSVFTTAGKGVTFDNGRVAFAMNGKVSGTTNEYVIYSDNEGDTWQISPTAVYAGADESKLEIMNDNSLLMSIRRGGWNTMANRGYNRTTGDASGDGIDSWETSGIWGDEMNANGCNADILYYNRSTKNKTLPDVIFHTLTKNYQTHRKDLRLYMSFDQGATWLEAFQLQPGFAAYSSMQKLANGDLAIIYEDGSIGAQDVRDCFAINYLVISKTTLEARIRELYEPIAQEANTVKIVSGTTGETAFGTLSGNTWTSNDTNNPIGGLTLTKSGGKFDKFSNWNSHYNLAYQPAAANVASTLTITAPEGYLIKSYSLLAAKAYSATHTFTLTTASGTEYTPAFASSASGYTTVSESNLYSKSTTISVTTTDVSKFIALADFVVILTPEYPLSLNAINGKAYATIYLPFGITLPEDVEAYKITVSGEWACPASMGHSLPANTPALLVSEDGTTATFAAVDESASADTDGNALAGTLKAQHVDGYVLNAVGGQLGFYKLSSTGTLAANRAYLPTTVGSAVKGFILNWDSLVDGIDRLPADAPSTPEATIYNLAGQRISKPQKGINIINGKKFIIK